MGVSHPNVAVIKLLLIFQIQHFPPFSTPDGTNLFRTSNKLTFNFCIIDFQITSTPLPTRVFRDIFSTASIHSRVHVDTLMWLQLLRYEEPLHASSAVSSDSTEHICNTLHIYTTRICKQSQKELRVWIVLIFAARHYSQTMDPRL
jgi:hypothetical protein